MRHAERCDRTVDESLRGATTTPILRAIPEGAFDMKIAWLLLLGAAFACGPIPGGSLGEGAAIATMMIPFLLSAILFSYFGLQRRAWQQGGSDK